MFQHIMILNPLRCSWFLYMSVLLTTHAPLYVCPALLPHACSIVELHCCPMQNGRPEGLGVLSLPDGSLYDSEWKIFSL